jgi:hypothetical protein
MWVSNEFWGWDPLPGEQKEFHLMYSFDDGANTTTFDERIWEGSADPITLPPGVISIDIQEYEVPTAEDEIDEEL